MRPSTQRRSAAKTQPNCAKRLECVELAPAFGHAAPVESASKLVALQTLRAAGRRENHRSLRAISTIALQGFRLPDSSTPCVRSLGLASSLRPLSFATLPLGVFALTAASAGLGSSAAPDWTGPKREPRPLPRLSLNQASRNLYGLATLKNWAVPVIGIEAEPPVPTGTQSTSAPVRAGLPNRRPTAGVQVILILLPTLCGAFIVMVCTGAGGGP